METVFFENWDWHLESSSFLSWKTDVLNGRCDGKQGNCWDIKWYDQLCLMHNACSWSRYNLFVQLRAAGQPLHWMSGATHLPHHLWEPCFTKDHRWSPEVIFWSPFPGIPTFRDETSGNQGGGFWMIVTKSWIEFSTKSHLPCTFPYF